MAILLIDICLIKTVAAFKTRLAHTGIVYYIRNTCTKVANRLYRRHNYLWYTRPDLNSRAVKVQ